MAGVVCLLLSGEHIVEFEVTRAGPQHQEALAGREGTAGEAALVAVALMEDGHRTKPGRGGVAKGETHGHQDRKDKRRLRPTRCYFPFLKDKFCSTGEHLLITC